MKNYLKIVILYIKKYITRSFAIYFSMVLSIALIVGVGTLSKSAKVAEVAKIKYECGNNHVKYKDLNQKQLNILEKNKDIHEIGITSYYDSNKPNGDFMINLQKANEQYIKSCNSKMVKGKFPNKSNEIALEEWVIKNIGVEPKIGQKITIDLYNTGKEEAYILTGILEDRTREKSAGVMEGFIALDFTNNLSLDVYVTFNDKSDIDKNIKSIAKEANIKDENVRTNSMLLDALGKNGETDYKVITLGIIVSIISGIVIYGIFNISIIQRVSEYGIIRSIGGTSYQILILMLFELLILLGISIPVGIGLGILGAKIFSSISGGLFTEGTVEITKLVIPLNILVFSVIIVLLVIVIISILTFMNLKKVSPMDAIRKNIAYGKIGKRQMISINTLTKFISFPKAISYKNLFRNKKSFYMIVISMSLGSTIFIVSSFYAHLLDIQGKKIAETSGINTDYKVSMIPSRTMDKGIPKKDMKEIANLKGVESVKGIQVLYSRMYLDKSQIVDHEYFEIENSLEYNKKVLNGLLTEDQNTGKFILKNNVYGYDESLLKELDKYLLDGKLDIDKMNNEDIALITIPHPFESKIVDLKIGDKLKVSYREDLNCEETTETSGKYITREYTVGGIVDKLIDTSDYYTGNTSVDVIIPSSKFKSNIGYENYQIININKEANANSDSLNNKILSITNRTDGSTVRDFAKERGDIDSLQKNKLKFIYSIIVVLFVISLFNIMNNISYSLISRTNEFGMIRAIGITNNEFKQMVRFEGLTYGILSSLCSIIFGLIGQLILFNIMSPELISPKFEIQWKNYVIIILINILIGIIATYLPLKRLKKLSIVESIESLE